VPPPLQQGQAWIDLGGQADQHEPHQGEAHVGDELENHPQLPLRIEQLEGHRTADQIDQEHGQQAEGRCGHGDGRGRFLGGVNQILQIGGWLGLRLHQDRTQQGNHTNRSIAKEGLIRRSQANF